MTHRDRLQALAEKLVAEETVDSEEFEKLFSDLPPKTDTHGGMPVLPGGKAAAVRSTPASATGSTGPSDAPGGVGAPAPAPSPA